MEKWTRLLIVLAAVLLLLTFVAVGVRLMMGIHHTLLLFALGGLVAYALDPLVEGLRRLKLKREARVSLVFVGMLALFAIAAWSLGGHLVKQVSSFAHDLPGYKARAMTLAGNIDDQLSARGVKFSLTDTITHPPPDVRTLEAKAGQEAVPFLRHVVTDIGESLIVLLIALYFLLFGTEMRVRVNNGLPAALLSHAEFWETDVNRILGGFVRGQFIIALVMGALAAVCCLALGIKPWLLIGLFVVVASLIPVFGPYIGALPAIIAALVTPASTLHFHMSNGLAAGILVVFFVLINEIGSKVLYPKLVGAALGLHTVVVLFVIFAGLEIGGIVGVLFAAPITALVIVTLVHLYRYWQDLPDSLLADTAKRESRDPQTHDQIDHPPAAYTPPLPPA